MSYNVTDFTVKKIDGFTLPFAAVETLAEEPPTIKGDVYTFDRFYAAGTEIVGVKDGDALRVSSITHHGEGSGTAWDDFEGLLKQSTGYLRVRMTWEGGDTVEILNVQDGRIEREDV